MTAQPVPVEAVVPRRAVAGDRTEVLDQAPVPMAEPELAVDHRVAAASIEGPVEEVGSAG